jgi:signal transduction histidine kinase
VSDLEANVDIGRITQVLVNLLSNAIKFSPTNSRIVFDVKEVGDLVEVGINDSGPGIPKEHLGLIFSRFHQVKAGTAKGIKGSGLGLAIVQSIVTEHGGSIGVESTVGEGSRFWIRIPARPAREAKA